MDVRTPIGTQGDDRRRERTVSTRVTPNKFVSVGVPLTTMSRLLPSLPDPTPDDRDPRIVGVDDEEADELLSALGSETARNVLSTLHEEPATTSEIADEIDTSLQNVQYHLGRLSEAELVDVVGTTYSEKGREMNVYAPTDEPLVLFAGPPTESSGLKTALKRLLGGYGILGLAALLVQRLLSVSPSTDDGVAPTVTDDEVAEEPVEAPDDAAEPEPEATPTPEPEADVADEDVAEVDDGVEFAFDDTVDRVDLATEYALSVLEPGVVFFLGAALVFTVAWLYWYRSRWLPIR